MAPMMVDAGTRLDGASTGPGLSLTYQYTLVQFDANEMDAMQIESFKQAVHPQLRESACHDATLVSLRELGTTLRFSYADKTGREVMTLAIAPGDCKP